MRDVKLRGAVWLCLVAAVLAACVPVTTATIRFSGTYAESDVTKIEEIVERLGFSRLWVEPRSGGRYARTDRDGDVMSGFETRIGTPDAGFGISIQWKPTDGSLRVIFAERNTRFSDRGMVLMNKLVDELREAYGGQVSIEM